jgi:hypothetical protein
MEFTEVDPKSSSKLAVGVYIDEIESTYSLLRKSDTPKISLDGYVRALTRQGALRCTCGRVVPEDVTTYDKARFFEKICELQ